MTTYRGLTWDHPRGFNALAAAARRAAGGGLSLRWDRQPLEGFESHSIADLCARYDLVVLDHPHIGEAFEAGCLRPLENILAADELAAIDGATIGPCLASYRYGGRHWALPLDAAAQVTAFRADVLGEPVPSTWDGVIALSKRRPVALSIAGPHAVLSFLSIATALGEPPAEADPETLVSHAVGRAAFDTMAQLFARMPEAAKPLNPIGLLDLMAKGETVVLCPLVYGYVNYATPAATARRVSFADAPRATAGGRSGSTLGGTGIGISARTILTPALLDHLRWLMGHDAQCEFVPQHDGQPSRREAWHDSGVNRRSGDFYENTAATLEAAYVRPRHAGYIAFQSGAAAVVRAGLAGAINADTVVSDLNRRYRASRRPGTER